MSKIILIMCLLLVPALLPGEQELELSDADIVLKIPDLFLKTNAGRYVMGPVDPRVNNKKYTYYIQEYSYVEMLKEFNENNGLSPIMQGSGSIYNLITKYNTINPFIIRREMRENPTRFFLHLLGYRIEKANVIYGHIDYENTKIGEYHLTYDFEPLWLSNYWGYKIYIIGTKKLTTISFFYTDFQYDFAKEFKELFNVVKVEGGDISYEYKNLSDRKFFPMLFKTNSPKLPKPHMVLKSEFEKILRSISYKGKQVTITPRDDL